ncbi:protein-methionine-sulfoxide reductase heme-binding subunit MsrQ [Parasalinivibrio latis]|uniref:protein-methionine-sulfoxide reductase heme-binding subunit MsrQ n=1 Tax=Parasalinivibrio latis TaxID=2952610 RepID=UPI0030DFAA42
MVKITPGRILWIKGIIHFISTAFFLQLLWLVFNNGFGADPVKGIEHFTGKAALNSLLVTLCITPLVRTFRLSMLVRVRRLLGLYSFSWAFLHLAVYTGLDLNFDWQLLAEEIINRPYLLFGAASWLILFCLAVTSLQSIQRKLGKYWQKLHNLIYPALVMVLFHYVWSVKSGLIEPSLYFTVSLALLAYRWKNFKRMFSFRIKSRVL